MGWGHRSLNPTCQSRLLQVLPALALSREPSLAVQPFVPAVGAAGSQQHCREARSVFCWQLCTPDLSLPARQSRAYTQYPYITPGYIIHSTTKWTGKQFNVKAQSQEKLKLPGSLELQTVAATYCLLFCWSPRFRFQKHQTSTCGFWAHFYSHNSLNIKYWVLFIHTSPCYKVHLHIKYKWI